MKKLFAFMLTCVLALAAFSTLCGCGKKYVASVDWTVDLSKPIQLKGLYPYTGLATFGKDDTAKIIKDTTGYDVTYSELPQSGGDDAVNNLLTNLDPYNFLKVDQAQYSPYLENGTFLDLTEILQKTASGRMLYELIDLMDYGWDSVTYVDKSGKKHIYGIPDFGYCVMTDSALVWNFEHLKAIGYDHAPATMTEMTDAFYKLQKKYGTDAGNKSYHALCIPGNNSCEITQIKGAFEVPLNFFVDDDGNIQQYIFSDGIEKYAMFMSELRRDNILSPQWQSESADGGCAKFATGLFSCMFISYWWYTPLIKTIMGVGELPEAAGIPNELHAIDEQLLCYSTRIRGDGTHGSVDQEKARIEGDNAGTSYYTVIPAYMAETAIYTIDFLAKKLEHFAEYYGGLEGTHWVKLTDEEIPEGAPEYDPEDPWALSDYESYATGTIYVQPWEYKYNRYEDVRDEKGAIVGAQIKEEVEVKDGGYWIRLLQRYTDYIVDNSQYCNGTNSIAANRLFHLRETGFGAWPVTVPMDETIIRNPMTMCPPFEHWSYVNIQSRSHAKNGVATAMDQTSPEEAKKVIESTRAKMWTKSRKVQGVRYYFWSDDIIKEMTDWYRDVKLNRA